MSDLDQDELETQKIKEVSMFNRSSQAQIARETSLSGSTITIGNTAFEGRFSTVVFDVKDWSDERRLIGPFEKRFRGG